MIALLTIVVLCGLPVGEVIRHDGATVAYDVQALGKWRFEVEYPDDEAVNNLRDEAAKAGVEVKDLKCVYT